MLKRIPVLLTLVFILLTGVYAQKADVTVSLNEAFFDAFLDSVYQNFDPPKLAISDSHEAGCDESIRLLREMNGVRTAVRFRDGKIYVPLAFSGSYNPPFVGCVDFAGWAEANIDLEFDKESQRLLGRVHVLSVNINGTGGVGGSLIAKMLQGTIDKRLNPIEMFQLDKHSFLVPIQNAGTLKMKAIAVRTEVVNGALNMAITYQFTKP